MAKKGIESSGAEIFVVPHVSPTTHDMTVGTIAYTGPLDLVEAT